MPIPEGSCRHLREGDDPTQIMIYRGDDGEIKSTNCLSDGGFSSRCRAVVGGALGADMSSPIDSKGSHPNLADTVCKQGGKACHFEKGERTDPLGD